MADIPEWAIPLFTDVSMIKERVLGLPCLTNCPTKNGNGYKRYLYIGLGIGAGLGGAGGAGAALLKALG